MAYVSGDGTIRETQPWSITRIFGFFSGIFWAVGMFFNTLISPNTTKYGTGYTRNYRPGSGGSGPPPPPSKKFGGINTKGSMNMPGGCSSCRGG
ncbi:selenoprotein K [Fopius arisanus]|uniref:Selenoprotein K n=1 Tax=Fopius arisanus TaxID=64838 RepID=A0A9R1TTR5_9HYME|nr:PREDICTED: selenoprotein K-like [Fopius arisanus]